MINPSHPANLSVVRALRLANASAPEVMTIQEVGDPYFECGSHPEIVQHVWDLLGRPSPDDCCCLVYGTPVLVHDQAGVVLAVCYGTEYAIRIPEGLMPEALAAGCGPICNWGGVGRVTDLREELGPDWVFGCFAEDEVTWILAAYKQYTE